MRQYHMILLFFSLISLFALACGDDAVTTSTAGGSSDCANTTCGESCVDTLSDAANCGACGNACEAGNLCLNGVCQSADECDGLSLCGTSCVDLNNDDANCGSCGRTCATGSICTAGACVCSGGLTLCLDECVNTTNNPQHCGACANPCGNGEECSNGQCVLTRPEVCNNQDDDNDNRIDEGPDGSAYSEPCDNLCGTGVRVCSNGSLQDCTAPMPVAEECDMQDNDCDGLVDEGVATTYYEDADGDLYGSTDTTKARLACTVPPGQNSEVLLCMSLKVVTVMMVIHKLIPVLQKSPATIMTVMVLLMKV